MNLKMLEAYKNARACILNLKNMKIKLKRNCEPRWQTGGVERGGSVSNCPWYYFFVPQ